MTNIRWRPGVCFTLLAVLLLAAAPDVRADIVTDANAKAAETVSRLPAPPITVRMMAIVQVSVFEAVNAITARYPAYRAKLAPASGASIDAAVASATRTALLKLMPAQQAAIEADYQALLAGVPDGPAKAAGIALGEQAANAIVAMCADDGVMAPDVYRPHAAPGVYVPTVIPAVAALGQAPALGDEPRRSVPPRRSARPHQRDVGARLQRDQGARLTEQHGAHRRADGHREILGGDAAVGLLADCPLRGRRAGP